MRKGFLQATDIPIVERTWRSWSDSDPQGALYETPEYARYQLAELAPNYDGGLLALREDDGVIHAIVPYRFQRSLAGVPTRDVQTIGLGAHAPGSPRPTVPQISRALSALRPFRIRIETRRDQTTPKETRSDGFARLWGKDGTIPLADSWDAFVETRSARFRKHLRHALREMERRDWSIVDHSGSDAEATIALANELHDACLNHKFPAYRGRYRSAQRDESFANVFQDHGLGVYALRRGDAVASILYGVRHRDTFYLFRQGNDPAYFEEFADGVSLTLRAALIARLMGEGVRALEVVGGTEGLWAARPNGRVLAVHRSRAPHAHVCSAAARFLLQHHRQPWFVSTRRLVARVSPRLAKNAA